MSPGAVGQASIGQHVRMHERMIAVDRGGALGSVAVLEAGPGGRPLLLVHGFTGAKEDFADHVVALAERGWWVVAPDLRGHGASDQPVVEDEYSLDHFADDLWALADALGWSELVLLGHSMGGMASQVAALSAPERLRGLVLMDTSHGSVAGVDPELAAAGAALARTGGMAAVKEVLDALGDDAPLGSEAYERVLRERPGYREFGDRKLLGSSPDMYAAMIGQMLDQADRLDDLGRLPVRSLIIVGEQDEPFVAPSRRMADAMPEARLVVIPDAGHSPQFENPSAWFDALVAFLDELA